MSTRTKTLSPFVGTALATFAIAACVTPGVKLLTMEVYQNETLVLKTTFDAPDKYREAQLWRHAGAAPFAVDESRPPLSAVSDDPLRAKLSGPVTVRIVHVESVETSVSVDNLELIRDAEEEQRWYLPKNEVERLKRASE